MRKIDLIIIHCSATRADSDFSAQDVDTAHRYRGFSSWGYHYYIRKSGQVELMRSEDVPGAHARGYNANSLGVCYEGGLDLNYRRFARKCQDLYLRAPERGDAPIGSQSVAELSGGAGGGTPGFES